MTHITINELTTMCQMVDIPVHNPPPKVPEFFTQNKLYSKATAELRHLKNLGVVERGPSIGHSSTMFYWKLTDLGKSYVKAYINSQQKQSA